MGSSDSKRNKEVRRLAEALRGDDVNDRRDGAVSLGDLGDASAVPALVEALRDNDARVRKNAAYSLGDLGDASAVPALAEALRYVKMPGTKSLDSFLKMPGTKSLGMTRSRCRLLEKSPGLG